MYNRYSIKTNMDSVALFLSQDNTLHIISALRDAKEKCEGDGRRIMAKQYADLEEIMRAQYEIARSVRENMDRNGGEYRL